MQRIWVPAFIVISVVGVVLAVVPGVLYPPTVGCPRVVSYLVGPFDVANTQVAGVVLVTVALVKLCVVAAVRAFRAGRDIAMLLFTLLTIAGVAAVAPVAVAASSFARTWAYTPLEGDTGGRDLIVREWSFLLAGGGELLERDGIWLTRVGEIRFDDGTTPFAHGAYEVRSDEGEVTVDWMFDSNVGPLTLTLPRRGDDLPIDGCARSAPVELRSGRRRVCGRGGYA